MNTTSNEQTKLSCVVGCSAESTLVCGFSSSLYDPTYDPMIERYGH